MTFKFWAGALCALAFAVSAQAVQPARDSFYFCVAKNSSASRDDILDVTKANCTSNGRAWLRVRALHDGKPFNASGKDAVTKAIIVMHGGGNQPSALLEPIRRELTTSERRTTWLLGPQFLDLGQTTVESNTLYWKSVPDDTPEGRNIGDASVHPVGAQVSAFDVMDQLVRKVKAWAPKIREIVIVGHSGGGRFVQRYSMATTVEDDIDIPVRYVISAPSSYAYLTAARYQPPSPYTARVIGANCDGVDDPPEERYYDAYPYGLTNVPTSEDVHYVHGTRSQLQNRVRNKHRLYQVGEVDTDVGDGACGPMQQGASRVERAWIHWHHLRDTDANANTNASFCQVSDVGHGTDPMVTSDATMQFLRVGNVTGVPGCFTGPAGLQ